MPYIFFNFSDSEFAKQCKDNALKESIYATYCFEFLFNTLFLTLSLFLLQITISNKIELIILFSMLIVSIWTMINDIVTQYNKTMFLYFAKKMDYNSSETNMEQENQMFIKI